jgi:MFS family permease
MGVIGYFVLPSTPRDSKFLTDEQKDVIELRLQHDRPTTGNYDRFSLRQVFASLRSPHVILVFIIFFCLGTTLYGLALFLPSIIKQLGFSPVKSQLLSVGPFAVAFALTIGSAYYSDRSGQRGPTTAAISVLAVVGFAMYLKSDHKYVSYGSLYLTVPGVYAAAPAISAWMANNSEPHYRRATSIALGFVATNAGGILSTWRFPTKEGPRFTKTTIMDIVFSVVIVVGALLNMLLLSKKNLYKQKNREKILAPYRDEKREDGGERAWEELGDRHPDFVYVY